MRKRPWEVTFNVAASASVVVYAATEEEAIEIADELVDIENVEIQDFDLADCYRLDAVAEGS